MLGYKSVKKEIGQVRFCPVILYFHMKTILPPQINTELPGRVDKVHLHLSSVPEC